MMVDPKTAKFKIYRNGQTYYFCSGVCKIKFEKNLSRYPKKKGWFTRFLESIAEANQEKFGGKPPSCCDH